MWDEGSGSGGYIWLMMGTLPVGFVLIVIGVVSTTTLRDIPRQFAWDLLRKSP